jgi:uncharacterized RDD family membrane protein YckC
VVNDPLVAEEPAPPGRRALAHAADLATVGTWLYALALTRVAFWLQWSDDHPFGPWGEWFIPTLTFVVMFVVYHSIFVSRSGATPGQDLLRMRVVDRTTGERPRFSRALGRAILLGGVWMFPGWWFGVLCTLVIGATVLTDPERRMIHDHLAGTSVVLRLVPDLEPGQSVEEAEEERKRHFMPRMVNPLQIAPMQLFRHPHLRRLRDDEAED